MGQDEDWKYHPIQREKEALEKNKTQAVDDYHIPCVSLLDMLFWNNR